MPRNGTERDWSSAPKNGFFQDQLISLRDIFSQLGFEENWKALTDQQPSYQYNFGNLQLTAVQVMNFYLHPVFIFGGILQDRRSIKSINFEMPLEVEPFEQGVAWITYGIGKEFQPINTCPWLKKGREWQNHLPWVRKQKEYESRPICLVERDWFKIAAKKMREIATKADEEDVAMFEFDGEVLKISFDKSIMAMPAQGKRWEKKYKIKVNQLDWLPKKMMKSIINLSVWEGNLTIGNRRWKLVQ